MPPPRKYLDPSIYTVAWFTPLEIETRAAQYMLDEAHEGEFADSGDYSYIAGEMCEYNVIIATFATDQTYGNVSAAALASHTKSVFRNIKVGFLVGIAAGLPRFLGSPLRDIRLGDILVAKSEGDRAAVVHYDLGKSTAAGFQILKAGHSVGATDPKIRAAFAKLKLAAPKDTELFVRFFDKMKHEEHNEGDNGGNFEDPGLGQDQLYDSDGQLVPRSPRRDDRRTRVWYGPIGSGDKLSKHGEFRDKLRDEYNILGLEMEAAGIMSTIPVGVIRGVSDYGDENKNNQWQPYAAAMAAAYAKAVLERTVLPPTATAPNQSAPDRAKTHREESQAVENGQETCHFGAKGGNTGGIIHGGNSGIVMSGGIYTGPITLSAPQNSDTPALTGDALQSRQIKVCRNHLWCRNSETKFCNTKVFKSADWIFRQEAFLEWQRSLSLSYTQVASPALLTIKGKAFTGKSVLMKKAIDASFKNENVITLYHFFGQVSSDPTVDLLRDLLGQLLVALPNCYKPWDDIRLWSKKIEDDQCVELSSCSRLQDAITRVLLAGKDDLAVRIFVDAFDNCFGNDSSNTVYNSATYRRKQAQVLIALADILKLAKAVKMDVRICVSGRHLPEYPSMETPATTIDLEPYMNETIGPFIRQKLHGIPDHLKVMRLLLKLSRSGAHNFHWAHTRCQDIIENQDTIFEKLEEIASKVLDDDEALYSHALRFSKASPTYGSQLQVFKVALGSFRPLTAEEFRYAYAVAGEADHGTLNMANWEVSREGLRAAHFGRFILDTTGGLLEIVARQKLPRYAILDPIAANAYNVEHHVLFQHRLAESFLRSDKGLQELGIASSSQLEQDCHLLLFTICGSVLEKCSLRGEDDVQLVDYACEYWLRHAQMCRELPGDCKLPGFMTSRCDRDKAQLFIKQQIYRMRTKLSFLYPEDQTSMMTLLATLGSRTLLRRHVENCQPCRKALPRTSDENPPSDRFMSSLDCAIRAEQVDMVIYLLDFLPPRYIDNRGVCGQTLLYTACFCARKGGSEQEPGLKLVKALIERGANPCKPSYTDHDYPLHYAISEAHIPLIKVLCQAWRERDEDNYIEIFQSMHVRTGWTPLHYVFVCEGLNLEERESILRTLSDLRPRSAELPMRTDDQGKTPKQLTKELEMGYRITDILGEFTESDEDDEDDEAKHE